MKYPLEQRCGFHGIETSTFLTINKKNNVTEAIWWQLAVELHEAKYGDRIAVYTDGSVKDENAACAVWSKNFKLFSCLRNGSSLYTAELNAIYYALSFIKTCPENL